MKKLIVSLKTPDDFFNNLGKKLKEVGQGKIKVTQYEVSFSNIKDLNRFLENIGILALIQSKKPASVYQLEKMIDMDVSNLNKIILFFENSGVIKLKKVKTLGRINSRPIVDYQKIEFNLAA
jgi:predicted transcriptional regulator